MSQFIDIQSFFAKRKKRFKSNSLISSSSTALYSAPIESSKDLALVEKLQITHVRRKSTSVIIERSSQTIRNHKYKWFGFEKAWIIQRHHQELWVSPFG